MKIPEGTEYPVVVVCPGQTVPQELVDVLRDPDTFDRLYTEFSSRPLKKEKAPLDAEADES